MVFINNSTFIQSLEKQLNYHGNRALIVLVGTPQWLTTVKQMFNNCVKKDVICFSDDLTQISPSSIDSKNYRSLLGTEQQFITFDAESSFNVDAFAALSGTIRVGGIMLLSLTPESISKSPFIQRFLSQTANLNFVYQCSETSSNGNVPDLDRILKASSNIFPAEDVTKPSLSNDKPLSWHELSHPTYEYACRTKAQQLAVEGILKVVSGHRDRPLVITSDRGRGKSTALALACVNLLQQSNKRFIITAPHPDALAIFFTQLKTHLPQAQHLKHKVVLNDSELTFIPLDALLSGKPTCQLLMVDEAAGIPMSMLKQLLHHYHRQVFVSTIHGYEGAGRGFSTKFIGELSAKRPNYRHLHLSEPIRWSENDPLELATFQGFLLNAKLEPIDSYDTDNKKYCVVDAKQLLENDTLLEQIFGLLVTAHYQTKPSDLKMILDDENIHILIQYQQHNQSKQVLSVALLLNEGDIASDLSLKVKQSLRRVKGHLTPQSLLVHNGIDKAFDYQYLRVIRIAVQPSCQGLGLGSELLNYCQEYANELGADYLSSSFGANPQLINFWRKNGFSISRIGFTKDAASGEHSALLLKSLSHNGKPFLENIEQTFYHDFLYFLADEFKHIDPILVAKIFDGKAEYFTFSVDKQTLLDFSKGYRVFSSCAPTLFRWLIIYLSTTSIKSDNKAVAIFIRKLLQKHDWSDIVTEFDTIGKKATLNTMKHYVQTCFPVSDSDT